MERDATTPLLAITMGDVAGIGPEIVAKSLARADLYDRCRPLVIGDERVLRDAIGSTGVGLEVRPVGAPDEGSYRHGGVDILQPGDPIGDFEIGEVSEQAGAKSVEFIEAAADFGRTGQVQGIVTAPLNKEAMHRAGFTYPGHTELLAELFDVKNFSLVLTAEDRYFFHITTHVSLRDAIEGVTVERTLAILRLANTFAKAVGKQDEPIAVTGFNPHASEGGLFGDEEEERLRPAMARAAEEGIETVGPLPADAVIPQTVQGRYRLLVVCYHDQGHAPFKAVYGDQGVNITVGLPVVRTSVDHGTAFDIAGQGIAREDSLLVAVDQAIHLAPYWRDIYETMKRFTTDG